MAIAINEPAPAQLTCFKAFTLAAWASQICSFRNGLSAVQITAITAPDVLD
jgi:hypothetical protein